MNWITNYVRPKIRSLMAKQDVPENLWEKCPSCSQMIFHRELEANHQVCANCGHHMRIGAKKRLELLFDEGRFKLEKLPDTPADPLKFRDRERYTDRLKRARASSGAQDAIQVAEGTIGGQMAVVAAFDFGFMGGSMGIAVGNGLVRAAELAVERDAAFIAVPSSGGARMQEGVLSLMQLPRTVIAVQMVKDAGLPFIALLTDPTTGGVSASFAMLGDIQISEPGAVIGFAGARVIEETIRETLPSGFQRAEYLLEHGMLDMVVARKDLHETLSRVLKLLREPAPAGDVVNLPSAKAPAAKAEPEKAKAPSEKGKASGGAGNGGNAKSQGTRAGAPGAGNGDAHGGASGAGNDKAEPAGVPANPGKAAAQKAQAEREHGK